MILLAAVIPPNHPALPERVEAGSIKSLELIDALNKLDRTGLVTANVDLFVTYEGDVRHIVIHVQVVEFEGELVVHKDLLTAEITVPMHHRHHDHHGSPHKGGHHHKPHHKPHHQSHKLPSCSYLDMICRLKNWGKSAGLSCGGFRHGHPTGHHGGGHHHPGEFRHRLNRPRHGFMRFILGVVVPVVIGAAVGVGIGILCVFIVELVGGIIMRIRGRGNAEYVIVDSKDDEELPVYEELEETPAYPEEKQ